MKKLLCFVLLILTIAGPSGCSRQAADGTDPGAPITQVLIDGVSYTSVGLVFPEESVTQSFRLLGTVLQQEYPLTSNFSAYGLALGTELYAASLRPGAVYTKSDSNWYAYVCPEVRLNAIHYSGRLYVQLDSFENDPMSASYPEPKITPYDDSFTEEVLLSFTESDQLPNEQGETNVPSTVGWRVLHANPNDPSTIYADDHKQVTPLFDSASIGLDLSDYVVPTAANLTQTSEAVLRAKYTGAYDIQENDGQRIAICDYEVLEVLKGDLTVGEIVRVSESLGAPNALPMAEAERQWIENFPAAGEKVRGPEDPRYLILDNLLLFLNQDNGNYTVPVPEQRIHSILELEQGQPATVYLNTYLSGCRVIENTSDNTTLYLVEWDTLKEQINTNG